MPSTRCAWSWDELTHARNLPECDSTPTSTNTRHPHGVSLNSSQHRLAFLAGRMIDHRHRPTPGPRTRPTRRPQPPASDLADERHITLPIAELRCLLEQCRRPKMRILGQPLPNISLDHIERIPLRCCPPPRHPFSRQVSSYCFSVSSQMAGNSRDRPSPFPQRVYSPRIPPEPTSAVGLPLLAAGSDTQQLGEGPTRDRVFASRGCVPVLLSSRVGYEPPRVSRRLD